MHGACLLVVLGLWAGSPPHAHAQPVPPDTSSAESASAPEPDAAGEPLTTGVTLARWADIRRVRVLDRFNTLTEVRHDRGRFLHILPNLDREYDLDLLTYEFTPSQAYNWHAHDRGFLSRGGSIERTDFALVSELKQRLPIGERERADRPVHAVDLHLYLREDVQAQRSLIEFAYRWQFADRQRLGVRHTFSEYKPDLDASLFYEAGAWSGGHLRAEVTFVDLYNDFISTALGIDEEDQSFVREYGQRPFLLQLHARTPVLSDRPIVQAELVGGVQPLSEAVYSPQDDAGTRYRDDETLYYVAGMIAARLRGEDVGLAWPLDLRMGLTWRRDFSRVRRVGLGENALSDYTARQALQSAGGFVDVTFGDLRADVQVNLQTYTDRQTGENYDLSLVEQGVDYEEPRSRFQARLFYEPSASWPYVGLGYANVIRNYPQPIGAPETNVLGNRWTGEFYSTGPSNYRATLLVGYSFADRGFLEVGVHYDTDGDVPTVADGLPDRDPESFRKKRFDNGFARLVVRW